MCVEFVGGPLDGMRVRIILPILTVAHRTNSGTLHYYRKTMRFVDEYVVYEYMGIMIAEEV